MKLKNEKGFGLIEAILILVVLAVISFIGYRAYQARQKPSEPQQTSTSSSQTTTSSTPYLTIDSLRVRIPLSDKTKNLKLGKLKASTYNSSDQFVAILAPELDASWTCSPDPDENFKGTIGSISITAQTKRSGPYDPTVTTRVGNTTYGLEAGGANCTANALYQQLVDTFKTQFTKLESY